MNIVKITVMKDNREISIGEKRNRLIESTNGEYFAFIDDDDMVSDDYIKLVSDGCKTGVDCCSLIGNYYLDGVFYKPFIHSIKYTEWNNDNPLFYERCPNHLNAMRRDKVGDIKFDDVNFGEDGKWSYAIRDAKRLNSEYYIDKVIYNYLHLSTSH